MVLCPVTLFKLAKVLSCSWGLPFSLLAACPFFIANCQNNVKFKPSTFCCPEILSTCFFCFGFFLMSGPSNYFSSCTSPNHTFVDMLNTLLLVTTCLHLNKLCLQLPEHTYFGVYEKWDQAKKEYLIFFIYFFLVILDSWPKCSNVQLWHPVWLWKVVVSKVFLWKESGKGVDC